MWYPIVILLVSTCTIHSVALGCEFEAVIEQIKNCPNSKNSITISNPGVVFTQNCSVVPKGCVQFTNPNKKISVKYEVYKPQNAMVPLLVGTKEACGFKIKNWTLQCPTKKDDQICAQDDWSYPVPKAALNLAASGRIRAVVNVKTDTGSACFEGQGYLKKKK